MPAPRPPPADGGAGESPGTRGAHADPGIWQPDALRGRLQAYGVVIICAFCTLTWGKVGFAREGQKDPSSGVAAYMETYKEPHGTGLEI